MTLRLQPLPYHADGSCWLAPFTAEPWAVLLESGRHGQGRYDICAARPLATLISYADCSEIHDPQGVRRVGGDPFQLLRQLLAPTRTTVESWPFCGGAIGYFGYDLARQIERLPDSGNLAHPFPDLAVGIYGWCVIVDHQQRQTVLLGQRDLVDDACWRTLVELFLRLPEAQPAAPLQQVGEVSAKPQWPEYQRCFAAIQHYIREGDCYQVNFARRFQARVEGDPWQAYRLLRQQSPAPYGAYLQLPQGSLLCNSPERFLTLRAGRVTTSPIKGTRPRGGSPDEDARLRQQLWDSDKDRAENLMIVDLLRNDLGRSCRFGSIQVEQLFRIESFATVHHLVSDISGQLAEGLDALALLRNCFPGGSITGAPKLRAMQIIEELESARRGPYCGSLAYIGFDGNMDSNILIRTMLYQEGKVEFWAGGGIVADSDAEAEFQETEQKAVALRALLVEAMAEN